jgi:hypothetical protein
MLIRNGSLASVTDPRKEKIFFAAIFSSFSHCFAHFCHTPLYFLHIFCLTPALGAKPAYWKLVRCQRWSPRLRVQRTNLMGVYGYFYPLTWIKVPMGDDSSAWQKTEKDELGFRLFVC